MKNYIVKKTVKITLGYRNITARNAKEAQEIARDMGEVNPDFDEKIETGWKAKLSLIQ